MMPKSAYLQDFALLTLRSDWKPGKQSFAAGSLVAIKVDDLYAGKDAFTVLFAPDRETLARRPLDHAQCGAAEHPRQRARQPEAMRLRGARWKRQSITVPANAEVSLGGIRRRPQRRLFHDRDRLSDADLAVAGNGRQARARVC